MSIICKYCLKHCGNTEAVSKHEAGCIKNPYRTAKPAVEEKKVKAEKKEIVKEVVPGVVEVKPEEVAVAVKPEEKVETSETVEQSEPAEGNAFFENLTKEELIKIADNKGIKVNSRDTKKEIIKAILGE